MSFFDWDRIQPYSRHKNKPSRSLEENLSGDWLTLDDFYENSADKSEVNPFIIEITAYEEAYLW